MKYITNSEVQAFKSCPRRWWFEQYRGLQLIQPKLAGPANVGDLCHRALRYHYDPTTPIDAAEAVRLLAADNVKRAHETEDPETIANVAKDNELAIIMIDGYLQWLEQEGADSDFRVIAPEMRVEAPFFTSPETGIEYRLLAKLDLRVERISDAVRMFLDHKTVGSLGDIPKLAYMNEQMLHYCLTLRIADPPNAVSGATFNMMRKVKRTSRANPPFYARHTEFYNDTYLRSYWYRVYETVIAMERMTARLEVMEDPIGEALVAIPRPSDFCNWGCDFKPVCPMYDDGSDPEGLLPRLYETVDPLARYNDDETLRMTHV